MVKWGIALIFATTPTLYPSPDYGRGKMYISATLIDSLLRFAGIPPVPIDGGVVGGKRVLDAKWGSVV